MSWIPANGALEQASAGGNEASRLGDEATGVLLIRPMNSSVVEKNVV